MTDKQSVEQRLEEEWAAAYEHFVDTVWKRLDEAGLPRELPDKEQTAKGFKAHYSVIGRMELAAKRIRELEDERDRLRARVDRLEKELESWDRWTTGDLS